MRAFQQKTCVHQFSDAKSFAEAFQINEKDFILASKTAYDAFFGPLNLKDVVFKRNYGKVSRPMV